MCIRTTSGDISMNFMLSFNKKGIDLRIKEDIEEERVEGV